MKGTGGTDHPRRPLSSSPRRRGLASMLRDVVPIADAGTTSPAAPADVVDWIHVAFCCPESTEWGLSDARPRRRDRPRRKSRSFVRTTPRRTPRGMVYGPDSGGILRLRRAGFPASVSIRAPSKPKKSGKKCVNLVSRIRRSAPLAVPPPSPRRPAGTGDVPGSALRPDPGPGKRRTPGWCNQHRPGVRNSCSPPIG